MVAPEDMERLAKGVLAIQLPGSLDDILSMIQNIRGMLANFTEFKEDLKKLEDQAKTAQDLLENALDIRLASTTYTEYEWLSLSINLSAKLPYLYHGCQCIRDRTKGIDVTDLKKTMTDTEKTQDKVKQDLEKAKESNGVADKMIKEVILS